MSTAMENNYRDSAHLMSRARFSLMLPHHAGIDKAIASAFRECELAFHEMDERLLDDNALRWVVEIRELMDTTGIPESPEGTFLLKARALSVEQQSDLRVAVNDLADWFARQVTQST